MSKRFDSIQFDQHSIEQCAKIKEKLTELEILCSAIPENREKAIVMTRLEEAFMWVGKAVAAAQIARKAAQK